MGKKCHRQFKKKPKNILHPVSHRGIQYETRTGSMLGRKQNKTYYNVTMRYIQASAFWTLIFHTVISLNSLVSDLLLLFTYVDILKIIIKFIGHS
jgi:hypothetical protein